MYEDEIIDKLQDERDLLRRQVEVLLWRIDKMAQNEADAMGSCNTCECRCHNCGEKCVEHMREWSLEQAKKGGGGDTQAN